jgi:hypothetical protein
VSARGGDPAPAPVTVRDDLDLAAARPILRRLAQVDWGSVDEMPGLLAAVTVGDDQTRAEAWWNLWDCVQHDGSVDEAVLPAAPVLVALGDWRGYPDRATAIVLLREIATADGIAPAHDHQQFADLREALAAGTRHLAARWRTEPPEVRRALVWLLTAVPEMRVSHHDLVAETLPPEHRPVWEAQLIEPTDSPTLESWVYGG